MKTISMKTSEIKREWHLVDLKGKVLGRAATEIAVKLIGKNKVNFTPHIDGGDYVVAINAQDVVVTGNKALGKLYQHHSGIPGGFREINFEDLMKQDPTKVIVHALKGMLPKNKLQADRLKRLKVYVDGNHPYEQQVAKIEKKDK